MTGSTVSLTDDGNNVTDRTLIGSIEYMLKYGSNYDLSYYDDLNEFDSKKHAFDNYGDTLASTTENINKLLDGTMLQMFGLMTGKRQTFALQNLDNLDLPVVKFVTGSLAPVSINGFYEKVENQFEYKSNQGTFYVNALYSQLEGAYIVSTNVIDEGVLVPILEGSALYNGLSKIKKIDCDSYSTNELAQLVADIAKVFGFPHYKFAYTEDLKEHLTSPVYLGDVIEFKDLKYTNDEIIKGALQGVKIDYEKALVRLACVSGVIKPPVAVLDEQLIGGLELDEATGGTPVDEQ
jgi:hypothetical protein